MRIESIIEVNGGSKKSIELFNRIRDTVSSHIFNVIEYANSLRIQMPEKVTVKVAKREKGTGGIAYINTVGINAAYYKNQGYFAHEFMHIFQAHYRLLGGNDEDAYLPSLNEGGAYLFSASYLSRGIKDPLKRAAETSFLMEWGDHGNGNSILHTGMVFEYHIVNRYGPSDRFHIYYNMMGKEDWKKLFNGIMGIKSLYDGDTHQLKALEDCILRYLRSSEQSPIRISRDYLEKSRVLKFSKYVDGTNMAQIALIFDKFDEKKTIKRFLAADYAQFVHSLAETIRDTSAEEARNIFNSLLRKRQKLQYSAVNPRSRLTC
jgi:hypothetical protein